MARENGPRLGRGLAALLGDSEPAVDAVPVAPRTPSPGTRSIAVADLEPGPFQPRRNISPEGLTELSQSIAAQGILQPLLARPHPSDAGRYQLIAGERRWRAAQQAGLDAVPVLVRALNDTEAMAAALVENLQRQDLNPIEEAEGYRRLIDEFDMTQEQLGQAVGKSRSHIANALRMLNLPAPVREAVQNGQLTAGHAKALLAHPDPAGIAPTVIARGLNVRQTEALAAGRDAEPARTRAPAPRDPEMEALERDLTEKLGLRVAIRFDGKGGSVTINYRSLDQLDGIIALLAPAA